MTLLETPSVAVVPVVRPAPGQRPSLLVRRLGPAWPLKLLLLGFPLWWGLGLASFACQLFSIPMALQMRRRGVRLPVGFGVWVLFLLWMLAGVVTLWAVAPGTVPDTGISKLVGFGYRVVWYLAVTVALLYPLSLRSTAVPAREIASWLSGLFLAIVAFGVAGLVLPTFEFSSPTELLLPGTSGFLQTLVHPSLTTYSDFLGYTQPRPKAPFLYANAWGNNLALTVPFFVYTWLSSRRTWQRLAVAPVLAVAAVPIAYSLNRGLWLSLVVSTVCAAVALARAGRLAALYGLVVSLIIAVVVLLASPLWATITLRVETPHSNQRRQTVASTVISTTWAGSPLLGFGSTRTVEGNFESIAGTGTTDCRQCAAPPLGTQGFMWRLILTTGFVGTALFLTFLAMQFFTHVRRRAPMAVLGSITLVTAVLLSLVYDSLESPLFITMLAVGLMNRERIEEQLSAGRSQA